MTTGGERTHLVITGLMGVGKSTVADAVAAALGRRHRDSDDDLQRLFARTGAELAAEHSVEVLHRLEAAVLLGALAGDEALVVSAAASVVDDPWCHQALAKRAVVVVLTAPVDEIVRRANSGDHRRPIDAGDMADLAWRRLTHFAAVADLMVDASPAPDEVVDHVLDQLGPLFPQP